MKIYFDYYSFDVERPVITTGVFDGVHKGHREILNRLNKATDVMHGESVVVTFWPHPRLVLQQDVSIKLLNTLDEKLRLLEECKIQHVVIIPFTEEFSKMPSELFIKEILVQALHVKHFIIGYNHHFGKGREGNFDAMLEFSERYDFTLEKLEVQTVENEKVSSTLIRKALSDGNVKTANNCLGYDYMITGNIIEGDKIGRTIGFPTANVKVDYDFKLIPREGVYAVEVDVDGKKWPGMLNIGYRPTVNAISNTITIEVHIINFSGDIYNKGITLYFKHRIRNEIRFNGLDHLKQQLNTDKAEVIKLLGV